jgi:hypothetical protein
MLKLVRTMKVVDPPAATVAADLPFADLDLAGIHSYKQGDAMRATWIGHATGTCFTTNIDMSMSFETSSSPHQHLVLLVIVIKCCCNNELVLQQTCVLLRTQHCMHTLKAIHSYTHPTLY